MSKLSIGYVQCIATTLNKLNMYKNYSAKKNGHVEYPCFSSFHIAGYTSYIGSNRPAGNSYHSRAV